MARSLQFTVLGICLAALFYMWMPDTWAQAFRHHTWRLGYTIAIAMILFILPAIASVFSTEKVRPGKHAPKPETADASI